MTSREALVPRAQPPASVAIIGAGAIGVEFAYFLNAFGSKVTLIEVLPQVVPVEDEEVARLLHRSFEKQGIAIHTGTKAENIKVGKKSVTLDLVKGDQRAGARGRDRHRGHRRGRQSRRRACPRR